MCKQTQYIAMKVIRMSPLQLVLVRKYLREEVQIIHLFRDPRGVISSRIVIDQHSAKQDLNIYIR
ncbi:MAG: hypothetical protein M3H12_09075, partial [Chromatiales bacterium]